MKKDYMTRLERAARWRLPPREADDVVADYREMMGDPPRPEEELLRDLGRPRDAVKSLVQPRQYRIWLAVFLVASACVLTLGFSPTMIGYPIWRVLYDPWNPWEPTFPGSPYIVAVLGAVTALMWFRWQGRKEARLPKAIPILLAVLLACCGGILLYCWAGSRDFVSFATMWGTVKPWIGPNSDTPTSASIYLPLTVMAEGSGFIALAGEVGLVKARTRDRRWTAVYIMALTVILDALAVVAVMTSMDPTFSTFEEIMRQLLLQTAGITAVGLIGAGVALC